MEKIWINCFFLPSKFKGELGFRVRTTSGIIEGWAPQRCCVPSFGCNLYRNDFKPTKGSEMALWGCLYSILVKEHDNGESDVTVPDGRVIRIKSSRIVVRMEKDANKERA